MPCKGRLRSFRSHGVISPCYWLSAPPRLALRPQRPLVRAKGRNPLIANANPITAPTAGADEESEAVRQGRRDTDRLICISDIRILFKLGRTAAYELTHRSGFPAPVQVSRRCLRWWASEVDAYADTLQREGARSRARRASTGGVDNQVPLPRRITGTVRAARSRNQRS